MIFLKELTYIAYLYWFSALFEIYYDFWILESRILKKPWNWLVLTSFKILGMFPTQFWSSNLILNVEFENYIIPGNFQKFPRTLDIALVLASFDKFHYIGFISHSILVKELDFQCRIWKLHHSWKLPEISWNSGYWPGIGQFWLISIYRVYFPLNSSQETWFSI